MRGCIPLCRKPDFPWCIVFIYVFAQTIIISSANFCWYKPQTLWWYSPGLPWDPSHFGVMFATCCSSGTEALLSRRLPSTASSHDSCLPIETHLFLASCYSSFSLFKQSLMPLNYDFWWNLQGVLHGEGAGMGTHLSPFMVNTKEGKKS